MPIACPHCAKPVAASAVVCPHCARDVRAVKERSHHQSIVCPRCTCSCDVVKLGDAHLDLCRRCRGIWFDRGELHDFRDTLNDADLAGQVKDLLQELGTRAAPVGSATYLTCPVCNNGLPSSAFARVRSLVVHTCANHGTWVDHDVAVRLVEMVQDGGIEKMQAIAAREDTEAVRRKLHDLQIQQKSLQAKLTHVDLRGRVHLLLDWIDFL